MNFHINPLIIYDHYTAHRIQIKYTNIDSVWWLESKVRDRKFISNKLFVFIFENGRIFIQKWMVTMLDIIATKSWYAGWLYWIWFARPHTCMDANNGFPFIFFFSLFLLMYFFYYNFIVFFLFVSFYICHVCLFICLLPQPTTCMEMVFVVVVIVGSGLTKLIHFNSKTTEVCLIIFIIRLWCLGMSDLCKQKAVTV